jgi:hypothetical protein
LVAVAVACEALRFIKALSTIDALRTLSVAAARFAGIRKAIQHIWKEVEIWGE